MARIFKKLTKNIPFTTEPFEMASDWVNHCSVPIYYIPYLEDDDLNVWPSSEGHEFKGLPWMPHSVIGIGAGERVHIMTIHKDGVIEAFEAQGEG